MKMGSLDFRQGHWILRDLRPHVSIRFKDMFKGIRAGQRPPFMLKDRADRGTELEWFMSRFPLDMTEPARNRLVESGEPVLLVGWHRDVYDIWLEALADLNPVMFTGSETAPAKAKAKAAIIEGRSNLMIMSLRSGAGLDGLQGRIAHVVFGELDWSPQVHVQVTGRVHRTGQIRPVTAHYLHVDGGSDPVILSTLGLKASQSHGILNPFATEAWATPVDENRMRSLARKVLGIEDNQDA